MMEDSEAVEALVEEIARLADRAYQQRVWYGGPSSGLFDDPSECLTRFLYDFGAEEFVTRRRNLLRPEVVEGTLDLAKRLRAFDSDRFYSWDFLDAPEWVTIRDAAASLLGVIRAGGWFRANG